MSSFEKELHPLMPPEQVQQTEIQSLLNEGVNLLLKCDSMIRNAGFASASFKELCKILFIRIQNPKGVAFFLNQNIDNQDIIQDIFNESKKQDDYFLFKEKEKDTIGTPPVVFRQVLIALNLFDWAKLTNQVIGEIFEIVQNKLGKGSTFSVSKIQTYHSIVNYMIAVLEPKQTEIIVDPCLGMGTFVIKLYQHLYPSSTVVNSLTGNHIYGGEYLGFDSFSKSTAWMYWMYRMKSADIQIYQYKNGILEDEMEANTCDVIFANLVGLPTHLTNTNTPDLFLLERCLDLLKPGGRMGIILTDERLFSKKHAELRKRIESKSKIFKITSLPPNLYITESIKMSIVFLKKFTEEEAKAYEMNPGFDYKIVYADVKNVGKNVKYYDSYDAGQNQLLLLAKEYKDYLVDGAMKNQILLKETSYSKLINWTVAYLQNIMFEKVRTYTYKKLGDLLSKNQDYIMINDTEFYKRILIRAHNQGIELRDIVIGATLKIKKQCQIEKGQLLIATINAGKASIGIVPDELHHAIVTSNFLTYNIKSTIVLPQYLEYLCVSEPFTNYLNSITTGIVIARLDEALFLNIEIPIPPLEEQITLCKKMIDLKHQIKELQQSFYEEKKVFKNKLFKIQ